MDLVTAVDASPKPAFLVDATGLLKHANAAGQKALRRKDFLRLKSSRVKPANPEQERQFSHLLRNVTVRSRGAPRGALRLFGARGASTVLFVHSLAGFSQAVDGVRVALILSAQPHDPEIDAIRLRVTFEFTPAEDRLARDLILGSSLRDTSKKYHLGRETLKSQLSSLFRKTGTHRQGELVAYLLSSLSDPSA